MTNALIQNWNKVVRSGDDVYHLGDMGWGDVEFIEWILSKLNGNIHVIWGNHDKHNRSRLEISQFVSSTQDYKEITVNGQPIVLFHYGARVWNRSHHGAWLLFGHSHGNLSPHGKSVDVGVDSAWITGRPEYRPFSFDELVPFMASRDIAYEDHHKPR